MEEFAADFETSSKIVYKKVDKQPIAAYQIEKKMIDGEEKNILTPCFHFRKTIDREKSETWVYHAGIKSFENNDLKEFYSIEEFMSFVENYPDDMKINFHNAKFDTSFILQFLLKNNFKQVVSEENRFLNKNIFPEDLEKFDFSDCFVKKWLSKEGYLKKGKATKSCNFFETSVTSMGILYAVKIYYLKEGEFLHYVEIFDSMKLLNFSIRYLGEKFLNEKNFEKEVIDYTQVRPKNRPDLLTAQDHKYLERDIDILKKSVIELRSSDDIWGEKDKMTIASLALDDFKECLYRQCSGKENGLRKQKDVYFKQIFPVLSSHIDNFCRRGYKGGFCYVHPYFRNKLNRSDEKNNFCVLDVNSLFPYIMYTSPIPYGEPIFSSKDTISYPERDGEVYDYYFVKVRVCFTLKEGHIPSIMLKGSDLNSEYNREENITLPLNRYLKDSSGYYVELTLTKDDYELMHEQYDCKEFIDEVYYFRTLEGIFTQYIDKWMKVKKEAGKAGDKARRSIAKLFLNSLYGKFGSKTQNIFKFYKLENGYLRTFSQIQQQEEPIFVPCAAAITAGGRRKTIETSQKIHEFGLKKYGKEVYCYSDTDSIHTLLSKKDLEECLGKEELDLDKTGNIGLWDIEHDDIIESKFIRPKTYLEVKEKVDEKGHHLLTGGCAGLPKEYQSVLSMDVFNEGATFVGKLMPVEVQGGTLLYDSEFTIKKEEDEE